MGLSFISVLPFSVVVMIYNITKSFNSQSAITLYQFHFLGVRKKSNEKIEHINDFLNIHFGFRTKTTKSKNNNSTITTNEIDRINKTYRNRQCSRFEFGDFKQ
jgi:hypothetical protein